MSEDVKSLEKKLQNLKILYKIYTQNNKNHKEKLASLETNLRERELLNRDDYVSELRNKYDKILWNIEQIKIKLSKYFILMGLPEGSFTSEPPSASKSLEKYNLELAKAKEALSEIQCENAALRENVKAEALNNFSYLDELIRLKKQLNSLLATVSIESTHLHKRKIINDEINKSLGSLENIQTSTAKLHQSILTHSKSFLSSSTPKHKPSKSPPKLPKVSKIIPAASENSFESLKLSIFLFSFILFSLVFSLTPIE